MANLGETVIAIQDLLQDLIVLKATANGGTSTLTDTVNLFDSNAAYTGSHLWFYAGTAGNLGKLARVDGSTQDLGTLSFTPAVPSSTATSDVVHMHNLYGEGWTRAELVRRVQSAITQSEERFRVARVDTIAGTFDWAAPVIDAPAGVIDVNAIEFSDFTIANLWHEIPPHLWDALYPEGKVEISGLIAGDIHGQSIRLRGRGAHPAVAADSDAILIDMDWIVYKVAAESAAPRRDRQLASWAVEWKKTADAREQESKQLAAPNTRRVR